MKQWLDKARETLEIEAEGIRNVIDQLGEGFEQLVRACVEHLDKGGKIVLCGVGKNSHVGRKIAATLASTGSPAVFLHPVEAMHGDLGILQKNDILIALSYSGETEELVDILPCARRLDVPIAAITGYPESKLSQWSDLVIPMKVTREACPFNLAPTASTTALLALGDALAMVLLEARGFTKEDYGRLHPGGAIGKAVTLKVADIMRSGSRLVTVPPESTVKETLLAMTKSRCGSAVIVDKKGCLAGIFCDSDFRRHAEDDMSVLQKEVGDLMTRNPAAVYADQMAVDVLKLIEAKHIDDIIVIERSQRVVGIVDVQDLPGLKLM